MDIGFFPRFRCIAGGSSRGNATRPFTQEQSAGTQCQVYVIFLVLWIAMRRTERLFAIAELLRSRRTGIKAEALADRFGVTVRTIYRDLDGLRAAAVPVIGERGRGGGLALDKSYSLPPVNFTAREAALLVTAGRWLERTRLMPFVETLRSAIDKVQGALPAARQWEVARLVSTLTWIGVPARLAPAEVRGGRRACVGARRSTSHHLRRGAWNHRAQRAHRGGAARAHDDLAQLPRPRHRRQAAVSHASDPARRGAAGHPLGIISLVSDLRPSAVRFLQPFRMKSVPKATFPPCCG